MSLKVFEQIFKEDAISYYISTPGLDPMSKTGLLIQYNVIMLCNTNVRLKMFSGNQYNNWLLLLYTENINK